MGLKSGVLVTVGFAAVCSTWAAYAQTADEVVANMRRCASEQEDARRLSCYDREIRPASARSAAVGPAVSSPAGSGGAGVAGAGAAAPVAAAAAGAAPPAPASAGSTAPAQAAPSGGQSASLSSGGPNQPVEINKLTSRVAAVARKPQGQAIITLDNGQVWEQTDADAQPLPKSGDPITIQHGMLGGFYLLSSASAFRVQRVK